MAQQLPKQVREQLKRAEQIAAQVYGEPDAESEPEIVPQGGTHVQRQEVQSGQEEEQEPKRTASEPTDDDESETITNEQPAEPAESLESQLAKSEQRYRTLQGKYKSEVPRMAQQIRDQQQQIDSMQSVIENMNLSQSVHTPKQSVQTDDVTDSLTQEEIDDYGEELIEVIRKKASEVAAKQMGNLHQEIADLRGQLSGVSQHVTMNERDKVYQTLDRRVPKWKTINQDELFLAWLDEVDPFSGYQRGKLLATAFDNNDAERVVSFFEAFAKEDAALTSSSKEPAPKEETPKEGAKVQLEDYVAPGQPAHQTTQNSAPAGERVYTRQQIAQFYADIRRGKYAGKEKERMKIEKDIVKAVAEDRVTD